MRSVLQPCVLLLAPAAAALQQDAPNLLVFVTDQHNPRALGAAGNGFGGASLPLTPSLDRLAQQGVHVPLAYCASPQCQPARMSMLTGRWPHHHGLRSNQTWERPAGELMLPELLRRAGYHTATVGKHHLSWLDQPTLAVTDHGYDEVLDMDDYFAHCAAHGELPWTAPARVHTIPGLPSELGPVGYTDNTNAFVPSGYFADRAIEYLEARAPSGGDGEPFALWCTFFGPHTPILPTGPSEPEDWAHRHDPPSALLLPPNEDKVPDTARLSGIVQQYAGMTSDQHREVLARYYGLVGQIDFNIGRVLLRLEELGLKKSTLVVFTADHGEFAGEMGAWKKGGGAYECLTRVPTLFRLPGVLPSGARYSSFLGHVDLAPTIAELLALSPSEAERATWDGLSLAEALRTGVAPAEDVELRTGEFQVGASALLRWIVTPIDKLTIDGWSGGDWEYFDLVADPWEETNLYGQPGSQTRVGELADALRDAWGDPATHAPAYSLTGDPQSIPARAAEPFPRPGTAGVRRDVDMTWMPATSAAEQDLWLGVAGAPLELVATLRPMVERWNPGTLPPHAEIRWRVDGHNANGVNPGTVWTFHTAGHPDGPALATEPSPPDGARGVPRSADLMWTAGADATGATLWLARGHDPLEPVKDEPQKKDPPTYSPPDLRAGETYRWRIDSHHASGTTVGSEWSFRVSEAGLPGVASAPCPAHLALGVSLDLGAPLTWTSDPHAVTHRVHFGTEHPLPLRALVDVPQWSPGPLEPGRTYFWRVDEENEAGVRRGRTWRFTADG